MAETKKPTAEEISHRWQEFRIRCIELALKGGATAENVVEAADKLATYIMKGPGLEAAAVKTPSDPQ